MVEQLRRQFAERRDVRIGADAATNRVLVEAPQEVQKQLAAQFGANEAVQNELPANAAPQPTVSHQLRLQHVTWQDLLQGLRGFQGRQVAVSSPVGSNILDVTLTDKEGGRTRLEIDQRTSAIRLTGTVQANKRWLRVIEAFDEPADPNRAKRVGALNDAAPSTITRTIALLGGNPNAAAKPLPGNAPWGGDVVNQFFGQQNGQPLRVAQADGAPAPQANDNGAQPDNGDAAAAAFDPTAGAFLGDVDIQFLEGTDIFIVRGQARDLERVMAIIDEIERQAEETQPEVEVYPLEHVNSESMANLINSLISGPLQARQGDISVTALVKPNALLLIGREAGVKDTIEIIDKLDEPVDPSAQFEVFQLKNMPAVDAGSGP